MIQNLFESIPSNLKEEFFEQILTGNSFRMERIISNGHSSQEGQWYDQAQHEWVILLCGSAQLQMESGPQMKVVDLCPGDYLMIPKHCRHRVSWTEKNVQTVWLAIHFES